MKLFRAFSLIDSSRLLSGQNPENFVKVDWVCYLRDEPLLPFESLIEDYHNLPETGKAKLWIERRANYLLSQPEVDELKEYLEKQYSFSIEVEQVSLPLLAENLVEFNEQDITGTIILRDRDEPFPLSINIIGMVSSYRDLINVRTVGELLGEIDRRNEK
ncbi:MAG: hypothetical protein HOK41_04155 [Nitrospina sp.]|nr:hypothetical protein [Nitrospina sp.]MBT6716150.1 hypothetical protein [Nitrospina sp.]